MKLVTVIPIARGIFKDTLTYWSGKEILPGQIAAAPVKNRIVNSLVISAEEITGSKADIKNAPFSLKKINSVKQRIFSPEFVKAAERASIYFASPMGGVLQAFSPKIILDAEAGTPVPKRAEQNAPHKLKIEKMASQSEDEDRLTAYKSLIREEFAKKASLFICFPTVEDVDRAAAVFQKGIEEYTFVFHGKKVRKDILRDWQKALSMEHPVVIIATPSYLGLPRNDLSTIIIERESSHSYKTIARPAVDARVFAEMLAEEIGAKIIFGDTLLRVETLYRHQEHELSTFTSVKFRSLSPADGTVVPMKKYREEPHAGKTFTVLSNELKALVELSRRERGRVAVIAGRRGLSATTVCSDCGVPVRCEKCGAHMVLHDAAQKNSLPAAGSGTPDRALHAGGQAGGRFFLCHKCGGKRVVEKNGEERCKKCGSWRLMPLGIGIERVAEELLSEFPGLKIIRIDSDAAKTAKAAKKAISDFYGGEGEVLLGTDMAIQYLNAPVIASAIVGIDSLLTIPDYRINEKIFSLILALRGKTERTILLQTQDDQNEVFYNAINGDVMQFYRREIEERKKFGCPPFTVLIKVSWDGKPERVDAETMDLSLKLAGCDIRSYASEMGGLRKLIRMNILIKIPRGKWPDEKILDVLRALPPKYVVTVDPDSIV